MTDTAERQPRTPGMKFLVAVIAGLLLAIPLFTVYLLTDDRQSQSRTAQAAIAQGWGGPQVIAGPTLMIPYEEQVVETVTQNGQQVQRANTVARQLVLAPDVADIATGIAPQRRAKSIYEAVVYEAQEAGTARFSLPADLGRTGVTPDRLHFDRAELRFGLSDARGLFGPPPAITVDGRPLRLQPGHGPADTGGSGFFAYLDAAPMRAAPIAVAFRLGFRGNGSLALAPNAGDTRWRVTSTWPHPSFGGGFLPIRPVHNDHGFTATWRVGNLALGQPLVRSGDTAPDSERPDGATGTNLHRASVDLVSPVDLYSEVNRSVKYGFLFIGFTFAALLMFDVIGGIRVATPEYLLVGAGLILFFVMLLAFSEVIGFTPAYLLASAAIIGLIAAYSAAVLGSWRRGGLIAGLLGALYAVLYILLSLEAFSLLIGSVLLFVALAGVMYVTRRLDWSGAGMRPGLVQQS